MLADKASTISKNTNRQADGTILHISLRQVTKSTNKEPKSTFVASYLQPSTKPIGHIKPFVAWQTSTIISTLFGLCNEKEKETSMDQEAKLEEAELFPGRSKVVPAKPKAMMDILPATLIQLLSPSRRPVYSDVESMPGAGQFEVSSIKPIKKWA
jgi:hypothetical protein